MSVRRSGGKRELAIVVLLCACGGSRTLPPPPVATGTSGLPPPAGSATADPNTTDTDANSGGQDSTPVHCRVHEGADDEATSSGTEGDEGFRFDVGSPDGGVAFEFGCDEAAQRSTNLGCEFWAVDLPNDDRGTPMSPAAAQQQFSVAVGNPSGLRDAAVMVFLPGEDIPFAAASVPPEQTHTFGLPPASIDPNFGSTDGQAFRILSDTPIVAYQFNPLDNTTPVYSNDASLLLPTHALGDDYVAVTGSAILLAMSETDDMPRNAGAFVSVVATQPGTTVNIDPSAPVVGALDQDVVLDTGEVWTIVSRSTIDDTGNLSGTHVRASAPVAVFAGNVATIEPLEAGECCADHLEHQLSPRTAWSSRYAIAPPPSVNGAGDDPALYRITGTRDGTRLQYCPARPKGAPTMIDADETATFVTEAAFTVSAIDRENSFRVAQFLLSANVLGDNGRGDPAMTIVPAALQLEQRFTFVVPAGYADNRVTLVAQGDGDVRLDGTLVAGAAFSLLGVLDGELFRYAQVELGEGQHVVESSGRVGVSVFGYDEAVSFAYPGGAGLRVISIPPVAG